MMKKLNCCLVVILSSVSASLYALDGKVDLGASLTHTNNSLKTQKNEQSELEQSLLAGLGVSHAGEKVLAELNYNAVHTAYDKDTQDDETTVIGDASISFEQIEQQLYWVFENSRQSVIRDRELVDLQSNREDTSTNTIRSRFIFRPSTVDSVSTQLSYSEFDYEDSGEQDSERAGANVSWQRKLSKVDLASLDVSYQDVSFDSSANDYEYYRAALGYQAELSRLSYNIAVGYNESKRDSDDVGGGYFEADAKYTSGATAWNLALLNELTDTSRRGGNDGLDGVSDFKNGGEEVDVFERTTAELEFTSDAMCESCTFGGAVWVVTEDYEILEDDSEELGLRVSLGYKFSRLISLRANAGYIEMAFKGDNTREDYDVINYGVSVLQQITRSLSLDYSVRFEERDSDNPAQGYDELRGGVRVRYQLD